MMSPRPMWVELRRNLIASTGERLVVGALCRLETSELAQHPTRGLETRHRLSCDGIRADTWHGDEAFHPVPVARQSELAYSIPIIWSHHSPQPMRECWSGVHETSLDHFSVSFQPHPSPEHPCWIGEVRRNGRLLGAYPTRTTDRHCAERLLRQADAIKMT